MTEPNVVPYLDTLKLMGINAKDWLIKAAKSKTIWFSTALTIFGALQIYLPTFQSEMGAHSGAILTAVGIVTALLRFATTEAIADKPVGTTVV
jgi:hypothetical protein